MTTETTGQAAPRSVWEFPLAFVEGPQTVTVPLGAEVVHVAVQYDVPVVWAVVDARLTEDRVFHIVGTGSPVPDGSDHVGTVHVEGYVFHAFLKRRGAHGPGGSRS